MKKIYSILFVSLIFCNLESDFYLQKEFDFAKSLIQEGEYDRAITSLKRINSFYPENSSYLNNLQLIANCYYLKGEYIESNQISKQILDLDNQHWGSIKNSIKCYKKLNYYYESNLFIDKYKGNFSSDKLDTIILNSVINDIYLYKIEEAQNKLELIKPNSSLQQKKKSFLELIDRQYPIKFKNKKTATLYSIVPGGGYIYTDHYQTAFSSFIVNCLLYKATYDAYKTDNIGIGHFCLFLNLSFYFGSMTGSWQLVDKHNKSLKRNFANQFFMY